MRRKMNAAEALVATGVDIAWLGRMLSRVDPTQIEMREAPRWFRAMWAKGISAVAMPWALYFTPAMMDRYETGAEPSRMGRLLVHELTHIEQFRRHGGLRHVSLYLYDYVRGRLKRRGHWDSYRSVRFEVEARSVAAMVIEGPR